MPASSHAGKPDDVQLEETSAQDDELAQQTQLQFKLSQSTDNKQLLITITETCCAVQISPFIQSFHKARFCILPVKQTDYNIVNT